MRSRNKNRKGKK